MELVGNYFPDIFLLFLVPLISSCLSAPHEKPYALKNVTRSQFPDDFIFGASTSAYQVEGAYLEDGRNLSNWDVFSNINGSILNGDNGYIADDDYHRYMEDIEILHALGVDAYRFSISWSRVLPKGRFGEVNPFGILFYNKIIDNLLLKGIQPFVTIHHFDYPQELEDRYGAWLSPQMQEDFVHFAKICFESFGDRVKYWKTINEPNIYAIMGYQTGVYPPAHCSPPFGKCSSGNSDIEPLIAMHNMLLAHGKAVQLYRKHFQHKQGGSLGIVVNGFMYEPLTDTEHDIKAASRALAFNIGWMFDPVVYGEYPPEMRHYLGNALPKFTLEERMMMKDSIDFIGINHYVTLYAKDCIYSSCAWNASNDPGYVTGGDRAISGFVATFTRRNGVSIGEPTGIAQFFVVPRGIEGIVNYVKNRYNNKPMFIIENGYSSPENEVNIDDIQNDWKRIEYHNAYLAYLAQAMRNGANVRGYFVWSLMDNFEWVNGYKTKFGLYYVDHKTLDRIPRASAIWYQYFLGDISRKRII